MKTRRSIISPPETSSNNDPQGNAELGDLQEKVSRIISTLPPRVREVITLRLRDELTYAEIATTLGVAQKTVEAQMSQALKALREGLPEYKGVKRPGTT